MGSYLSAPPEPLALPAAPTRPARSPYFTIPYPSEETVRVLVHDVAGGDWPYEFWHEEAKTEYLELLQGHLEDLYADGSLEHMCQAVDAPPSKYDGLDLESVADYREDLIDRVCWFMAQALRKTKPTRIAEAVPLINYVIARQKHMNDGRLTAVLPSWYLGAAYCNVPGKEEEAIEAFIAGFRVFDEIGQEGITLNELWARSHFALMLRRKGRIEEAMEQERLARQWILKNVTFCAPSTFRKNIDGPGGRGEHITDHGEILEEFSQIEEITPATAIWHKYEEKIQVNYVRKG